MLQLFVDACLASWKALNPEYEIRVLDDETVHEFLTPEDLLLSCLKTTKVVGFFYNFLRIKYNMPRT